ncbi:hypothetical protein D9M71_429840 [compost metagenome]
MPGDLRRYVDGRQFFGHVPLSFCIALVGGLAIVTQGHFRILPQTGGPLLQEDPDEVVPGRHTRLDQLFTQAQVLCASEPEMTAHGAALQVDIGLVMTVLAGDAV